MNENVQCESTGDDRLDDVLGRLAEAVTELNAWDLQALVRFDGPSTGLHAAGRAVETLRRRLGRFDANYVAAVEAGEEAARHACSSTAVFLREQLRVGIGEARRRVSVAHACLPRQSMTGPALAPRLPRLAESIADGAVSADHASVIVATMDKLPEAVPQASQEVCEAELVEAASISDPGRLATFAVAVIERADPDGALRDYDYAQAHRTLDLGPHLGRAGGRLSGELSVELLEKLQTVFDVLAKPAADALVPGERNGDPDSVVSDLRSPGERRHDALLQLVDLALAGDQLPNCGGVPATVVFHVEQPGPHPDDGDVDPVEGPADRAVFARTDHGNRFPVPDAVAIADQAQLHLLFHDVTGVPLWLGRSSRLASRGQTVALAARDRGCSFPGCTRPPSWCERHHVLEWCRGGLTDVDSLTLVCGYHHREFQRRGWRVEMRGGLPWWIPPAWIDPQQRPLRNHAHEGLPDTG